MKGFENCYEMRLLLRRLILSEDSSPPRSSSLDAETKKSNAFLVVIDKFDHRRVKLVEYSILRIGLSDGQKLVQIRSVLVDYNCVKQIALQSLLSVKPKGTSQAQIG